MKDKFIMSAHRRTTPLPDKYRIHAMLMLAGLMAVIVLAAVVFPVNAQRQDNRVGLVVQFGAGALFTGCYTLTPGMTGLDLLRQAGLDTAIEYQSIGALVCRIGAPNLGADGCDYPRQDCLCQARTLPWRYWAYWHLEGDRWVYSDRALSGRTLRPGGVDGWAWGEGTVDFGARPPDMTFEDVCPAPTVTSSPPPTQTPVTQPTATLIPTATETPAPTLTFSPTPLPTLTPTAVATATPAATLAPSSTPAPVTGPTSPLPSPTVESVRVTPTVAAAPQVIASATATVTPTRSPTPPASATPTPVWTLTLTHPTTMPATAAPLAIGTVTPTPQPRLSSGSVDLSRLTPVVGDPLPRENRQTPPLSYLFFAVLLVGLVAYLVRRRDTP